MKTGSRKGAKSQGVLVLPTNTDEVTMKAARASGYLVIPCDDPSKVAMLSPSSVIASDDLLMSAMHAVKRCGYNGAEFFVEELYRRMKIREDFASSAPLREDSP